MAKHRKYFGYSNNYNQSYDYEDDRYVASFSLNNLYKKYHSTTSGNIVRPMIGYYDRSLLLGFAAEYFKDAIRTASTPRPRSNSMTNIILSGENNTLDEDQFIDLFNCYYRKNKVIDSDSRPSSYKRLTELYIDNLSIVTNNSVMCSLVICCEIAISLYNHESLSEDSLSRVASDTYNEEMVTISQLGLNEVTPDYTNDMESPGNGGSNSLTKAITDVISMRKVRNFSVPMLNNTDFYYNLSDRLYSSVRNTFAESDEMMDVELLESEIIAEIAPEDIPVFLLPDCVKKALISDVHTIQPVGNNTFDIYIDVSGSMSNRNGSDSTLLDTAKGVTAVLRRKNIVNDIYCFNGNLSGSLSFRNFLAVKPSGGTSFSPIMANVEKTKRSSLVITDGEPDERDIPYNPLVSWIGIDCSMNFFGLHSENSRKASEYTQNKKVFLYKSGETEIRLK